MGGETNQNRTAQCSRRAACPVPLAEFGVRIRHETGQVVDSHLQPIPGLYACGEMVGGLFYFNYPSGTGLVSGAVFGRIAGRGAGLAATGKAGA